MPCPWSIFTPGTVSFCEDRLCGWIVEPANFWSNIGYLLAAVVLGKRALRLEGTVLDRYSVTAFLIFIGSSVFHMTGVWWGEFLDLIGMFLFSGIWVVTVFQQMGFLGALPFTWAYVGFVTMNVTILLLNRPMGIILFTIHITVVNVLEFYRVFRGQASYRDIKWVHGFFVPALGAWLLDIHKVVCDPNNHFFNGHAVWHLLNSVCLYWVCIHLETWRASHA